MANPSWHRSALAAALIALLNPPLYAQALEGSSDALKSGFETPPASARPRVWWHWLNGNITQDGIRKDLEWMHRVGIGGVQNFDVNLSTPVIVDKRLVYMSPEWKEAFKNAVALASDFDMEFAIASSPGWSETGGPWVQPQDGMKKVVWSETLIAGGKRFAGKLASPPTVTGPYQTSRAADGGAVFAAASKHKEAPVHYGDIAVLAYPVTAIGELPQPHIALSSGEAVDAAKLQDNNLETSVNVSRGSAENPNALLLTYDTPQTVRSATLHIAGKTLFADPRLAPRLEANVDGSWRAVAQMPVSMVPTTVSFAPVHAREFRVVLAPNSDAIDGSSAIRDPAPGAVGAEMVSAALTGALKQPAKVIELQLLPEPKIDRFEAKAGFAVELDYYALNTSASLDKISEEAGVAPAKVIDLTSRLQPDGTLDWTPPKGNWRVVRLGYSLLGTVNHPATEEATGLEVDKYDGAAVRGYMEKYLAMYRDVVGLDLFGKRGLQAVLTDSTEVGAANWTPRLVEQFKRLRGYDPTPWLPALTGAVIESRRASDAFLYDYRRTLADLTASEHYGMVATVAHEQGLTVYGEALEDNRPSFGDDMAMRSHADIPMAALWTYNRDAGPRPTNPTDIRGAASVAHIYGKPFVATESLTSVMAPWAYAPSHLRRMIDLEFALGVNRPVLHSSVHQPIDTKVPGLSMMLIGQQFNRHETWAGMVRPWMDYMARSSFLLQQGRNFADVGYFYGEEAPLTGLYGQKPTTDAPTRYAYDFVNADALMDQLSVDNGEVVTKGGARYKVLYLGGSSQRMTLPALQQIARLAEAGATIVGNAPQSSPGYSLNDKNDKAAYAALVRKLWSGAGTTAVGRGKVIAGTDIEAALASVGVEPDFAYNKPQPDSEVLFLHRRLGDSDLYFVSNRANRAQRIDARFRVTGKVAEIWRADTGKAAPVSYRIDGNHTQVPLDFEAEESYFVVFRKPAATPALTVATPTLSTVATLDGGWNVAFQADRGAPATAKLETLGSLSEQADPGIKYFSGVSTYTKAFTLPKGVDAGAPLTIDLGHVGDIAEVWVNGQKVGTVWHAPYRIDIGAATRSGRNQLEIHVANVWVNRLIGDAQKGAKKITYASTPTYKADAPLKPSGLIGPVQLLAATGAVQKPEQEN